jgi:glycosyltransferase involved in cell wall biosynthesis
MKTNMPLVSICIPVVRPQNMDRLLESIKTNAGFDDYEVVWEEDKERIGCPKKLKELVEKSRGELICFLGDDVDPQPDFLKVAVGLIKTSDRLLIGMNDTQSHHSAHWLASKKLLPLIGGEFFHTGYFHNFCDDELRHRAQRLDKFFFATDSIVKHNHPVYGTAVMDDDYKRVLDKERWAHDQKLFMERNCRISAAIIVKNEEKMLAECLDSIKGVDEIIIVDTGSTDKTKEVAAKYTDKIYDYAWDDHFANARNFAKSKATMDWCVSIDADEVIEPGGIELLRSGMSTEGNVIYVNMWSGGESFEVPRVFRNKPSLQWVGRWHEVVNETFGPHSKVRIEFRRGQSHDLDPDRNIRMAEKCLAEDPESTRHMFYVAREYAYRNDKEKAVELFNKYLDKSVFLAERADAYFWLAGIYWKTGEPDKARLACMSALTINANFKAAALLMSQMSWEHNAVQWRRLAETATNEGVLFTHQAPA